jgi:hypothetical protein
MFESEDHREIRESVRKLCMGFPVEYWQRLAAARAHPKGFVAALTEAGYLAALVPEEYGGAGLTLSAAAAILEEIQPARCNGAACHAQMYIMFGVTEPTSGTDTTSIRIPDQVLRRHPHSVEEDLGGRVVHHGADRPDHQAVAESVAHIDEYREARGSAPQRLI